REMAPFTYYDFMNDFNVVGNINLKSATINNYDFRYEYYPSPGETFNIGFFYKTFANPIENYVQQAGAQQFYLGNARSATNTGVELELRRSLANVNTTDFLKKFSTTMNFSYIISRVDLGDASTLSQDAVRPLQGQS